MRKIRWIGLSLVAVCIVALADANGVAAEEKVDQKASDALLRKTLRGVIDGGAYQFNKGQEGECLDTYKSALLFCLPLLGHRPELQKYIKEGLANAERLKEVYDRALKLNDILQQVCDDLGGIKRSPPAAPSDSKEKKVLLWDRLGGRANVDKIARDLITLSIEDPKVDFTRKGKYKLDADTLDKVKEELVRQISYLSSGPHVADKKATPAYRGLGITAPEYDAAMGHLQEILQKRGVAKQDIAEIMLKVAALGTEIVEEKKSAPAKDAVEPKKPAEEPKKPAETAKGSTVHGKITVGGKPLVDGKINYVGTEGKPISGDIKEGKYSLSGVQPGSYKITIEAGDKVNKAAMRLRKRHR